MPSDKSPGDDGLPKEFCEKFWNHIKKTCLNSVRETKSQNHLIISQRQAIVELIEKKKIEIED